MLYGSSNSLLKHWDRVCLDKCAHQQPFVGIAEWKGSEKNENICGKCWIIFENENSNEWQILVLNWLENRKSCYTKLNSPHAFSFSTFSTHLNQQNETETSESKEKRKYCLDDRLFLYIHCENSFGIDDLHIGL